MKLSPTHLQESIFGRYVQSSESGCMREKWMHLELTIETFFVLQKEKDKKLVDLVKKETQSLGMIKVEFALSVQMPKKTEKDMTMRIHQYFKNKPKEQMKRK